jgi:peroxiredoxin
MAIHAGDTAPSFTLYNTDKQAITLESLKGKNVLIHFFPAAFTGTCTAQLCNARDNMEAYTQLNCTVIGISVDMPFSLGEFKKQQGLSFDLLSDFNKTVITAYDMVHENFVCDLHNVAKRGAFLIDKNGVVQYAEVCPTLGDQPNYSAIKTALDGLQ